MKRKVLTALASLLLLDSVSLVHATDEWLRAASGPANNWSYTAYWSEKAVPADGETALFDLAAASQVSVRVGTVSNPHILFDGAAGSYALNSAAFSVGTAGDIVELGSTATSFTGSNVTDSVSGSFSDSGQTLTFENNSSNTTDALQVTGTVSGVGQLTLDGASTANSTAQETNPSETVTVVSPLNIVSSNISLPSVVKNGTGMWELTGTNSFTSLSVNNGTLAFAQAAAFGSSSISLGVTGGTSGTLESVGSGAVTISNNITVHGAGTLSWVYGSSPTFSGTQTITDSSLTFAGTTPYSPYNTGLAVTGKITGGTAATFDSNVNVVYGQTAFENAGNDYTGSTNIYNGGQLFTGAGGLLPSGTIVNIGAAGEINAAPEELSIASNQTIAALNGTSDAEVSSIAGNSHTVVVAGAGPVVMLTISGINSDGQAVNSDFGGQIGDGYKPGVFSNTALNITGGTVTFTGNRNNYSGGTTVAGGTFFANNTTGGSATGEGVVWLTSGGTLSGSGSIEPIAAGAGVIVADSAVLRPGTAAVGNVAQNSLQFILDSTKSHILDFQAPTSGIAQLEFTLGAGSAPIVYTGLKFSGSSSFIRLVFDTVGEVQFNGNLMQIDDLTGGSLEGQYLLFSGAANSDYAGLTTDANGLILSGLSLDGASASIGSLYLKNGDIILETPEPSSWVLLLGGLGLVMMASRSVRMPKLLSQG